MRYFFNMICGINRGCVLRKRRILCDYSKYNVSILSALESNGYIYGYITINTKVYVYLKYDDSGNPLIRHIKVLYRPSKHSFASYQHLMKLSSDGGEYFLSSNQGVISIKQAIQRKIGGTFLFKLVI